MSRKLTRGEYRSKHDQWKRTNPVKLMIVLLFFASRTGTVLNIIPMDSPIPGSNCLGGQQRNKLYTVTGTIDPLIPGQGLAYETNCIGTSGVRTGLFALGSDQI